jgi:hypothetical protein
MLGVVPLSKSRPGRAGKETIMMDSQDDPLEEGTEGVMP